MTVAPVSWLSVLGSEALSGCEIELWVGVESEDEMGAGAEPGCPEASTVVACKIDGGGGGGGGGTKTPHGWGDCAVYIS